jgi:hypothetical protein
MSHCRTSSLLVLLLGLSIGGWAIAQVPAPGAHSPAPGSVSASLVKIQRWFELEAPFSRPLKLSFDTRHVPGFEMLELPAFESRATLWQKGSLSVSLFERVAPAIELDCLRTPCAPILEQSLGLQARVGVGRIAKRVPDAFLFLGPQIVRRGPRLFSRSLFGIGGALDL